MPSGGVLLVLDVEKLIQLSEEKVVNRGAEQASRETLIRSCSRKYSIHAECFSEKRPMAEINEYGF